MGFTSWRARGSGIGYGADRRCYAKAKLYGSRLFRHIDKKDNDYDQQLNLPLTTIATIEALTSDQLATVRSNLRSLDMTDEQTREAIAEYAADGGAIEDLGV
jgi:hypothetical protein